jgi:predicted Rossmann fold flavoprotein
MKDRADIVVIGAGPAGLAAAIFAAREGAPVLLLERLPAPGRKLLATGGGRCNLTNLATRGDFMARFGRQGRFMEPALSLLDAEGLRSFLESLGVPTRAEDGFHVFPASESSETVLAALLREARALGVQTRTGRSATGLTVRDGRLEGVETDDGPVRTSRAVLAAGGKARPDLGSDGSGHALAERAGHTIRRPVPGLVPLVAAEPWVGERAGVSVPLVRAWIDLPGVRGKEATGPLLFTHRGLSGLAALDLSADAAELLLERPAVPLRVDLCPGTTAEAWAARFAEWRKIRGKKLLRSLLAEHLPASLGEDLCVRAGAAGLRAAEATAEQERELVRALTGLPFTVIGTEGFDRAMVTRGGVVLKEADPRTLESRKTEGLYLAGEILDLDGPCGGYNLQWAFASGALAGMSAARSRFRLES